MSYSERTWNASVKADYFNLDVAVDNWLIFRSWRLLELVHGATRGPCPYNSQKRGLDPPVTSSSFTRASYLIIRFKLHIEWPMDADQEVEYGRQCMLTAGTCTAVINCPCSQLHLRTLLYCTHWINGDGYTSAGYEFSYAPVVRQILSITSYCVTDVENWNN
jgi:hypothetical protein